MSGDAAAGGNRSSWEADLRKCSVTSELGLLKLAERSEQRKLLLPVDGSKHSERAFHWFLANLYRGGDSVVLAFVIEPPQFPPTEEPSASSFVQEGNKAYNDGVREAARLKCKFLEAFKEAGVPEADTHFQELIGTKPGETLTKYIEEAGVSCVVIGSRGLSKIKRAFLGSVSDFILHNANCPVIICPNRKDKDKKSAK